MAVLSAVPRVAVKNIIVATDFSPASELAVRYATAIARHYGAKVHLVHALEATARDSGEHSGALWGHETEAEAEQKLQREAERYGDIECMPWLLNGTPEEVVERLLSFEDIDLVVVGTHGSKGFRKLAIGAAAEHFFRHVHCPVLTVGPAVRDTTGLWAPRRVLLATDLECDESTAARCAVLVAREHNAGLALLHVAPPSAHPFPDDQKVVARPYFESRLRELLSYKPSLDYPAEFLVEFGEDAVAEILRVARQRAADLLVLSVHRQEPWGFHFVHEAYRIVAEAPCPVLITQRRY